MEQRFDVRALSPEAYAAMLELNAAVSECGLEPSLLELIKLRASQINGCAFCIGMHVPLARKLGIGDERMHLLAAWREAPVYTPRERAALAWTEALTVLAGGAVPDAVYEEARRQFSGKEISALSYAVALINGWNRLMIASRTPPQLGG